MKQISDFRRRKLSRNRKGGIEGLPMQLMIIIVVAGLGLALMVGWMGNIEAPKSIEDVEVDYTKSGNGYEVNVKVYDQDGYGLEGADVIITGLGARSSEFGSGVPVGKTGSDGSVSIPVYLNNIHSYGYIDIEISKPNYTGLTTTMLVTA